MPPQVWVCVKAVGEVDGERPLPPAGPVDETSWRGGRRSEPRRAGPVAKELGQQDERGGPPAAAVRVRPGVSGGATCDTGRSVLEAGAWGMDSNVTVKPQVRDRPFP